MFAAVARERREPGSIACNVIFCPSLDLSHITKTGAANQ
jgi:hypothetical protein